MPATSLGTRDLQRQQTHRRILDAATAAIRERGIEGTSVAAVAQAAGVSRQTFYDHFATLDDVVAEAFAGYRDRVAGRLEPSLEAPPPLPELLRHLVDALFSQMDADDARLRQAISAHLVRGVDVTTWLEEPLFVLVRDAVARAQEAGELQDRLDPEDLARSLLTALGGFLLIESEPAARRAERAHTIVELVLRGAAP